jgi:hypothetical protein
LRFVTVVVTVNVADVAPAAQRRSPARQPASGSVLLSDTTAPPLPAGAVRVARPVVVSPPLVFVLVSVTLASAGAAGPVCHCKGSCLRAPP